ncbi:glycoside hydrolase [Mycena albidolilacea]|uniref:Glycoside hydrolase n=1 Tax=Mycena albidolilacea TaxID=1033008 RepID=A0AAD6ZWX7_9AGAR|nr:glycoside hydrolase [Mycena albidolilacea]
MAPHFPSPSMLSALILNLGAVVGAIASPSPSQQLYSIDGERLPPGFIYGCATSAYQIEGAWNVDGKSPSIWDHFLHNKTTNDVTDGATGDIADNFYFSYAQDIPLFRRALGVGTYDFTIAWTRIMPAGRGPLNAKGLEFYQNVIRASNASGMSNICTLYHWDLPQSLQDEYGGWLNPKIVDDFRGYARAVFQALGDECSHWVTMNEPRTFCTEGFGPDPDSAPGVIGTYKDQFACMHHALLAHAAAVDEFRRGGYKGKIGIKVDGGVSLPLNPASPADKAAAARAMDFEVGWDVAPLYTGDYPPSVVASGAPPMRFTAAESKLLKGSVDFIGLDFYTSQWVTPTQNCTPSSGTYPECTDTFQQDPHTGIDIGRPTASDWNFDAPHSTIYGGIKYLAQHYNATNILISETGMGVLNETNLPLAQVLEDVDRIAWYRGVLVAMKQALDEGLPLTGFIPWSCIDNFEWTNGYNVRFGLINVAYDAAGKGSQKRNPKLSGAYLRGVLTQGNPINPYNFEV